MQVSVPCEATGSQGNLLWVVMKSSAAGGMWAGVRVKGSV